MPDYVRVRDNQTGHHVTILRSQFDRSPDGWTELKQDATYADGSPLPPKHKTTVSNEAAKKSNTNAGQSAEPQKEN
jgi:hypothetical protein